MTLALKLLPFNGANHSWAILPLDDIPDEFKSLLKGLPSRDVPEEFRSHALIDEWGESPFGITTVDNYGDPVKYVKVADLLPMANHPYVQEFYERKAAWAYLACLQVGINVALFWC